MLSGRKSMIYLNGQVVSTRVLDLDRVASDEPVVLGNARTGDREFSGILGELRISSQTTGDTYPAAMTQRLQISH